RALAAEEVHTAAALDLDDLLVVGAPARQARAVREQVAKSDVGLSVHAEVVEEPRHAVVYAQLPFPDEVKERRGRRQRLGERGEVEDRVLRERRDLGFKAPVAERAVVDDLTILVDEQHRSRKDAGRDRILHRFFDSIETDHRAEFTPEENAW